MTNNLFSKGMIAGILLTILILAVISFFASYAEKLEGKYFPVFDNVTITLVNSNIVFADLVVKANKVRDCKLISISAKTQMLAGQWLDATARMVDNNGNIIYPGQIPVPKGTQYLRTLRVEPGGAQTKLIYDFKCHALWNTVQEMFLVDTLPRQ